MKKQIAFFYRSRKNKDWVLNETPGLSISATMKHQTHPTGLIVTVTSKKIYIYTHITIKDKSEASTRQNKSLVRSRCERCRSRCDNIAAHTCAHTHIHLLKPLGAFGLSKNNPTLQETNNSEPPATKHTHTDTHIASNMLRVDWGRLQAN